MSRELLGSFELMVLLALIRLGEDAYGVPAFRRPSKRALVGMCWWEASTPLERLEEKSFVSSRVGEPTPERGGRAKRYFRITAKGLRQVRETRRALIKLRLQRLRAAVRIWVHVLTAVPRSTLHKTVPTSPNIARRMSGNDNGPIPMNASWNRCSEYSLPVFAR
jgi:PadR family transcriptional regulator, regulatory protein PadR